MPKKGKGNKNVRHDLENDVEYKDLDEEAQEYLKQFNKEWYYGTRYNKDGFELSEDHDYTAECERNNNRNKRDIFDVKQRAGMLDEFTSEKEFIEASSDEWEWQDVYKVLGKEESIHVIFEQAKRDILDGSVDMDVILSRFVVKILKLKTLLIRDRKINKRKLKERKK